jgi:soluble lytic murein transglycosylase-like protein
MSRLHITIATFAFMQLFSWPESINAAAQTTVNPESLTYGPPMPPEKITPTVGRICELIEINAEAKGIPKDFFARLIWKESRFDHRAVSPVGAQGIAQFMPYTAKERGLADPFDIEQAIPASAGFLSELKRAFGNWGLAAAAYNAGPTRVSNWMRSGGFFHLRQKTTFLISQALPLIICIRQRDHQQTARRKTQFCRSLPASADHSHSHDTHVPHQA